MAQDDVNKPCVFHMLNRAPSKWPHSNVDVHCTRCGANWDELRKMMMENETTVNGEAMAEESTMKICGSEWREYTCVREMHHNGPHTDRMASFSWVEGAEDAERDIVIDNAWLLAFIEEKTTKMLDTARRKNADYAGASSDPFGNFAHVEELGIATVEQGFLTRMTDKLCRIASLTRPGVEAQVKDEAIEDTLLDLANYSILLAAWLAAKRLRAEGKTVP